MGYKANKRTINKDNLNGRVKWKGGEKDLCRTRVYDCLRGEDLFIYIPVRVCIRNFALSVCVRLCVCVCNTHTRAHQGYSSFILLALYTHTQALICFIIYTNKFAFYLKARAPLRNFSFDFAYNIKHRGLSSLCSSTHVRVVSFTR